MGVKIEVFMPDGQSESRTTYKEKKSDETNNRVSSHVVTMLR